MRKLIPLWHLPFEIINRIKIKGKINLKVTMDVIMNLTMFEDNMGALATVKTNKMILCSEHIAIVRYCDFFKNHCGEGTGINLVKIGTNLQKVDIFTKGLAQEKFCTMRRLMFWWKLHCNRGRRWTREGHCK